MARRSLVVSFALSFAMVVALAGCGSSSNDQTGTTTPATTAPGTTEPGSKPVSQASAAELEEWQKDLNAVGCWAGPVDGKLGPETEAAIKEFQTAEGLTVDGLLGPKTESALNAAVAKGQPVCKSTTGTTHSGAGTTTSTAHGATTTTAHGATTTTAHGSTTTTKK